MDIRRLDLNLLLLLDGLLFSSNLSTTARRLGISQPSASAGLAKLRYFFHDELFVRTGRGLRPTPFAESLAQPVRVVIETISHEILLKPVFEPDGSERVFALTMPDLGEVVFLPQILKRMHAEAPQVGLKCINIPYQEVREALENGMIDLALGHFPDLPEPMVRSEALFEDRFVCIARKDHPTMCDDISVAGFLELEHLVVEREGRQEGFQTWSAEFDQSPRMLLQIPHFMSVPRLVASSNMVSVVPLSLATLFADVYGLQIFNSPITLPTVHLKQFWHRRMDSDPALEWFRGIVSSELRDRPSQAGSGEAGEKRQTFAQV